MRSLIAAAGLAEGLPVGHLLDDPARLARIVGVALPMLWRSWESRERLARGVGTGGAPGRAHSCGREDLGE